MNLKDLFEVDYPMLLPYCNQKYLESVEVETESCNDYGLTNELIDSLASMMKLALRARTFDELKNQNFFTSVEAIKSSITLCMLARMMLWDMIAADQNYINDKVNKQNDNEKINIFNHII